MSNCQRLLCNCGYFFNSCRFLYSYLYRYNQKRVIIGSDKFVVILKKVAVYLPDFESTVMLYVNPLLSEAKPEVSKRY